MRQTGIFQESGRYDQDTLDRIAALMEQENQGRLQNPNIFRPEIINNRGEHFFGRLKWEKNKLGWQTCCKAKQIVVMSTIFEQIIKLSENLKD